MEPFDCQLSASFSLLAAGGVQALLMAGIWWFICKRIKARADTAWREEVRRAGLDEQCMLEGRGSPSDRLFLAGLALMGGGMAVFIFLRLCSAF